MASNINERFEFLTEAAVMLHRYGTPSHRLERSMTKLAASMGITSTFLYTPTALVISLEDDPSDPNNRIEKTVVRRVDAGSVDVEKLISFDDLLDEVAAGGVSVQEGRIGLRRIDAAPSLYSRWVYSLACAAACGAVAMILRASWVEVGVAGMVGLMVAGVELVQTRWQLESGLLEPVAGIMAATASLCFATYVMPIDDRLTTLAGLIVLIPGLKLTIGLTELAVGHLSAGTARIAGALVSLVTLFVGVALVWRVAGVMRQLPNPHIAVPPWAPWMALVIAAIGFAIVFGAGLRQWPVILGVSIAGVTTNWILSPAFGVEIGAFAGSLVVGGGSNLYARIFDRPALVALTPSMLILVPGSLGYRSLAALLEQQTIEGVQFAFAMIVVAVSIVGGLLVANLVIPPRRIL